MLTLVTVGHGSHDVDFETHPCRPGTLLLARPGQVIRLGDQPGLDAVVVYWRDGTVHVDDPYGPSRWQLAGEDEDAVINEVSQLVVDCQRNRSGERAAALLRHQLTVLLLRIALLPTGGDTGPAGTVIPAGTAAPDWTVAPETAGAGTFERLRAEVERSYAQTRRVEDYARRLDCSVRTLTRACLAATGRSAKQVVDDRVALEARRLLAATDLPIADIGRRLGFPEPTNFGRFFQREVGRSPGVFRGGLRRPAAVRVPGQRRPLSAATRWDPVP
ncbi:AraC family transcriptional regulator [Polymorphospora sp. NPDC051019]|uniref:helix-turn-helix transcriptional regulator n=1 Tax=Polymorphospora sp. NPDC051019 TaxID=3155725 RepID=UPI00343EF644